jgi:hypothetical protein
MGKCFFVFATLAALMLLVILGIDQTEASDNPPPKLTPYELITYIY